MFSRSNLLLRSINKQKTQRMFSLKTWKISQNVFHRQLTSSTGKPRSFSFGERVKRSVKNVILVTVVSFGAFYAFKEYRRQRWTREMNASSAESVQKKKVVVLGTGWGAVPLLKHLDTNKYEVICVSPRNYFLMTPLLPSVSVGTVETRTVIESIRSLVGPRVKYIEAHCIDVNPTLKFITCNTDEEKPVSRGDDIKALVVSNRREGGASSRIIKDSARSRPKFDLHYDYLVVAIGSENNTFNIPGVEEHAHFLKEVLDARRIRSAISDAFESAMIPGQSEQEKKRLLNFVVVGGGPTGVEFAAELADLVREDLQLYFPTLTKDCVEITLIEALDHVLSMMDKKISEYTEQHFRRGNIRVRKSTMVKEVKQREVIVQQKGSTEIESIPCSVVVWATGIKARPLTNKIRQAVGLEIQSNRMGILTDRYLRVEGVKDGSIFAIGDCATIEQKKLVDRIIQLLENGQDKRNVKNSLTLDDFRKLVEDNINEFPQLNLFSENIEKAFEEADRDKSGTLSSDELEVLLKKADQKLRNLPATAQVASQEGRYLADLLNRMDSQPIENLPKFRYRHMGSLAYVGGDEAVLDFTGSRPILDLFDLKPMSGRGAAYLWKSFYFTEMFTGRTKALLAFDWIRTHAYGRDISRY